MLSLFVYRTVWYTVLYIRMVSYYSNTEAYRTACTVAERLSSSYSTDTVQKTYRARYDDDISSIFEDDNTEMKVVYGVSTIQDHTHGIARMATPAPRCRCCYAQRKLRGGPVSCGDDHVLVLLLRSACFR